jgi:hypothetical protein
MKRADHQRLTIVPVALTGAARFINWNHRSHRPPQGGLFALGVQDESGEIRGVAVVGRPVARRLDDGRTAEVIRLCTDGTPNACSALYGAAWRAARALGYLRLITYILFDEPGTSLRAAGWRLLGQTKGGSWNRPSRERTDKHPIEIKQRWGIGAFGAEEEAA